MDLSALLGTAPPLPAYTLATAVAVVALAIFARLADLRSAWLPIRTWLVMLPVAFVALWLGQAAWTLLITVIAVFAFREFARATGLERERLFVLVVVATIVAENVAAYLQRYDFFMALPMWGVLALALVPIVADRTEAMLQWFALSVLAVVLFGFFMAHLSYLYASPLGLGYLLFVVLATQLNDALQFLFGKLAGRRHWTSLSPNKTIEGSLLALAATILLAFAHWPLAFPHLPAWAVLLAGLIVGVGGQVGDLLMAMTKRNVGIKDWGHLLPGHGGIIDRINSLLVTAPVFAHVMGFLFGGFPTGTPGHLLGLAAR